MISNINENKTKLDYLELHLRKELIKRDFYEFVKYFWDTIIPEDPVYNWHIEYLCKELQTIALNVKERKLKEYDLIINIPPGTTKSTICTIMFPVWCWLIDPTLRFITGSYSDGLSMDHSVKSRDIIRSDKFKEMYPEISIKKDKDTKSEYENENGGSRVSTSVGGTITGKHGHILIIDDPMDPRQSVSDADRKKANTWWDRTLMSRKIEKSIAVTILIMQRLHVDDTTGHVLNKKKENIKHICLPATESDKINPPELKSRYIDGLLDTDRLSEAVLKEALTDLGSYGYAGQFDQLPAPEGGGKIKREWIEIVNRSELPDTFNADLYIDGAYTKNTQNDPTGLMPSFFNKGILYITNWHTAHLEMPELINLTVSFSKANNVNARSNVRIEPKASGKTLKQLLVSNTELNASEIEGKHVNEGKEARADACSPTIQSGRVKLVKGSWNEAFLDELCYFPNAKHDEAVDCLCYNIYDKFLTSKRRGLIDLNAY